MVAAMATVLCAPANATNTLTAQQYWQAKAGIQAMEKLNLLTFGDATLHSDVEGKVFIGGNLTGNNAPVAIGNGSGKSYLQDSKYRSLTVGGNATNVQVNNGIGLSSITAVVGGNATGVQMNNGSATAVLEVAGNVNAQNFNPNSKKTIRYGGTISGQQTQDKPYETHDTTLKAGGTADLKAAITTATNNYMSELSTLSQVLGALTPTTTLNVANQNAIQFTTPTSTAGGYVVADLTAAQAQALASGTFILPTSIATNNTLIINVEGVSSFTFGANETGNGSAIQQNIIWNFTDATTVTVNTAVYGSILAPKATIGGNSPINGSVVAKVFQSNGEVHLGTFNGNTGFLVEPPRTGVGHGGGPSAVPEPASWMTMFAGFGILGSLIRRQRRRERLAAA